MAQKTLFIEKPDGLRLAIPSGKFLAAWGISEREILRQKQSYADDIARHEATLTRVGAPDNEIEYAAKQVQELKRLQLDLRPYAVLLVGYEAEHKPLQMVQIKNKVDDIYAGLPDKSKFVLIECEGGHVCYMPSKIEQAEEIKLPAITYDDLELEEGTFVSVNLAYGGEHNKQTITVLVDAPITDIIKE